jgi:hypothetical protein
LFGDGAASDETDPTYAYERPGQYAVELRVTDVSGGQADAKQVLTIRPAGAVVVADAASGRLVVSLGSENGVRVGDRFEILGAETSEEPQAELEVVELIERGMCACLLLRGEPPEVGVSVRLLAPG